MTSPRRPGAIVVMVAASAIAAVTACSSGSGSSAVTSVVTLPPVTAAATTTVPVATSDATVAPSTTAGPVVGGVAAALFTPAPDGYRVDAAPPGTSDDLLTTVQRIPSAGEVIDSVDVRLLTGAADSSASLVVSVALRPGNPARSAAFGDAVVAALGPGFTPQPVAIAPATARYVEGPDPVGGSVPLRAVVVQRADRLALVLAVQGDRAALERLARVLADRLG